MDRFIRPLFLAAVIALPALAVGGVHAQQGNVQVYDKDRRDYQN